MKKLTLFLIISIFTVISCDNSVETKLMLSTEDALGSWNLESIRDSSEITIKGQTIYYFTGLTGIIYDTVTIDTAITNIDTASLNSADNYINLHNDSTYSINLNFTSPNSIAHKDTGNWEFQISMTGKGFKLNSINDTTYSIIAHGIDYPTKFTIYDQISYDTTIRVENVAVQCKAQGWKIRNFLTDIE